MTKDNTLPYSPTAELNELMTQARSKYPVDFETISIGQLQLQILQIKDMEAYIENLAASAGTDKNLDLPFWAKIWPTSLLLSYMLTSSYPVQGYHVLELGAGVGVCGLVAASLGAQVTLTDVHPDALLFARINVLKNKLEDRVQLAAVDFTTDHMHHAFERIIGSEVLYRDAAYAPLVHFLDQHLSQTGEALLAKSHIFQAKGFFDIVAHTFNLQQRTVGYKEKSPQSGKPERHLCQILRLTKK
jgi:predicted nicotinamide N-methyase